MKLEKTLEQFLEEEQARHKAKLQVAEDNLSKVTQRLESARQNGATNEETTRLESLSSLHAENIEKLHAITAQDLVALATSKYDIQQAVINQNQIK